MDKDISNNIRRIRESKGITQSDMATKIGSMEPKHVKTRSGETKEKKNGESQSNYAYLEGRGNKLTIGQLEKIADALGVTVIELLTGEAQKVGESERVKELEEEVKYWINKQKQDEKRSKQDLLFMAKMADKLAIEIEENQSGDIEKLRQGMTEMFKNLSGFFQMAANGESVYAIMEVMTSKIEKGFTSEKNS